MAETLKFFTKLDTATYEAGMARIRQVTSAAAQHIDGQLGRSIRGLTVPIAAVGAAMAAAFSARAIGQGVSQVFEAGRALQIMARQTGASVGGLSILQAKFRQAGLAGDMVATSIARLQKSIAGVEDEENKGGAKRLQQLGLNLLALQKASPDRQLLLVGQAISAIRDPAERAATSMQIFGRAGAQLGTVFNSSFGQMGPHVLQQAQLMAKNAAIFEQVSIRLERVGEITKTFYAGVADRVTATLLPFLDRLEQINLVGLGQRFGDALSKGAQVFTGALAHPELITSLLEDGLKFAFTSAGNVLMAGMKTAADFFQDGMGAAIEGLGDLIISALMRGFAGPIAFLQAQLENALDYFNSPTRQTKNAIANNQTAIAAAQKSVDYFKPGGQAEKNGDWNVSGQYKDAQANLAEATKTLAENRRVLAEQEKTEDKSLSASVDQRKARIMQEGVRFGLVDGGWTADQYSQRASSKVGEAYHKAATAFRNNPVEDVMGAGKYATRLSQTVTTAQQRGAAALGLIPSGPSYDEVATAEVASTNRRPATLPRAPGPQTLPATALMRPETLPTSVTRPLSAPSTPVPAAPWSFGSSWMGKMVGSILGPSATGPSPMGPLAASLPGADPASRPSGLWGGNVGLQRMHSVGAGTALDFDPSLRPGWTGAKNAYSNGISLAPFKNGTSLSTGGLGGGAYGGHSNILTQLSGRTNSPQKDPGLEHAAKTADNTSKLLEIWQGGGSGGGSGGGATVTGR